MTTIRLESREVLAAALPAHRLNASQYLRHAVEVDRETGELRLLCKSVKTESLADANAGDRNNPPTCKRCIAAVRRSTLPRPADWPHHTTNPKGRK